MKRLYRSDRDKIIAGICGGISEYFKINILLVRFLFIFFALFGGISIAIYIIIWFFVNKNPLHKKSLNTPMEDVIDVFLFQKNSSSSERKNIILVGIALITLGMVFFIRNTLDFIEYKYVWPIILIVFGIYLILKKN